MKSIKKMITLILVLCAIMSMAVPTFAASNECSTATSVAVDTNCGQFYVVHGRNIPANTKTSGGKTDFKLQQGALIKVTGTEGQYYKMDVNGTTRYVKKESARKANDPFYGDIYYTTKKCPLRPAPYEGSTTATLSKGTAVVVVGKLTNSKGNQWLMVSYKGGIHYIYVDNVKRAEKVTLEVNGSSHALDTLGTMQMKATVSPSAIRYTWSSSNTKVAAVDGSGVVTGITAGNATITASVNGIVKASWDITVTRNVSLDVKAYRQTTDYTCSAASALAVLQYYGKEMNTKDTSLYKSINGYVGKVTNALNDRLDSIYKWSTFRNLSDYEDAIYKSLAQGSPVIARVRFQKGYFNYSSSGHYTTIVGMYKDSSGQTWVKLVDSFVDRYKSNNYTTPSTGVVHVPLKELYNYGTYGGTSEIYLIFNP